MNEDYNALIQSVLDDPQNDDPRLVLADYIQEKGDDDRAEFIRAQCEHAKITTPGVVIGKGHATGMFNAMIIPSVEVHAGMHFKRGEVILFSDTARPLEGSGDYPVGLCVVKEIIPVDMVSNLLVLEYQIDTKGIVNRYLRKVNLYDRQRQLLARHFEKWRRCCPVLSLEKYFSAEDESSAIFVLSHESYRRGMVEQVSFALEDWRFHGRELCKLHPIQEVYVDDAIPFEFEVEVNPDDDPNHVPNMVTIYYDWHRFSSYPDSDDWSCLPDEIFDCLLDRNGRPVRSQGISRLQEDGTIRFIQQNVVRYDGLDQAILAVNQACLTYGRGK